MSIARCPYCDNEYDQDFEVEHEDICREEHGIHKLVTTTMDIPTLSGEKVGNYLSFEQGTNGQLEEIFIKFNGTLIGLNRSEFQDFFHLIELLKLEMTKL